MPGFTPAPQFSLQLVFQQVSGPLGYAVPGCVAPVSRDPLGSSGVRSGPGRIASALSAALRAQQLYPPHHSNTQSAVERVGACSHHRFLFDASRSSDKRPTWQAASGTTTPISQCSQQRHPAPPGTLSPSSLQASGLPPAHSVMGAPPTA
ncbi:hypothetical protein NDU88_006287 [Pleurodeles waltl]|uniref:Uncharacterized protein n=1 Tax=Pleurodeles waltl TaxID=8319 RepID=A0AAV7VLH2_PLEWA|nr:hypothetical protein NDU88_006287 [Pleurodeles waltl]